MNVKICGVDYFDSDKSSMSTFGALGLACLLLYACLRVAESEPRIVSGDVERVLSQQFARFAF